VRLVPSHSPYDAGRLLWYLGLHAVPGLESYQAAAGPAYARVLRLTGGPGVVRLSLAAGGGYDAELALTEPADESEALGQLTHLLDLDGDGARAEAALSADPLLGPLVAARPGLRAPGSADHVETLLCTIIGQQISLAGARTVTGRLVAALGTPLPRLLARDGLTHAFPTPDALAGADPEALPMPRARGRSLVAVAQAVQLHGESIASGTPQTATQLLLLPGVGPWTAAYLALRAGRDPDVFLPTDLAVRRALERHGLPGDPASALAAAAAWAPHRSLALMHLWFDLLEARAA
jgi:AraC family transcriptional regulator, regulatory protein of adaptative response / DNA-3-methyladenine glycosylase II